MADSDIAFNEILKGAGVEISSLDSVSTHEALHKVQLVDSKPRLKDRFINDALLSVERLLDTYPKLQPYTSEIIDVFVGASQQEENKNLLKKRLEGVKAKYPQPQKQAPQAQKQAPQAPVNDQTKFDALIKEITDLSKNKDLAKKIGPKNIKEFADQVKILNDSYAKAPANAKGDNLLKNLGSLKQWADTKQKESKAPTFSKLATIISSYGKAVGALISGNSKAAAEHKMNASQAIKELTQGKKVSQALDSIGKKTKSWAEKITQEKAKGQSEQKSR